MKCDVCGGELRSETTDLPFKTGPKTIVVVRDLPVLQCDSCVEYALEDPVMESVERILANVDEAAELEVVHYAA